MSKIVTDTIKLQKVVTDLPKNKSEEEVISAALFTALEKEKGFGLSANQIGVDKRMCVINIKEPMVLVNPKIVKRMTKRVIAFNLHSREYSLCGHNSIIFFLLNKILGLSNQKTLTIYILIVIFYSFLFCASFSSSSSFDYQ